MQDYYIKMMNQGYAINPEAVYFVEVRQRSGTVNFTTIVSMVCACQRGC